MSGSSFSSWRGSCTQYSSHLFPWITIVFGWTPQKFHCGVAWEKLAHIMSARIWILNAPFKMIGRPYYSKMEIFEWEQLRFPTLSCAVAWLKPIVEKHGEASAERMTLVKDDRLLKTWLMGMITSRERSCSPGKAEVPRDRAWATISHRKKKLQNAGWHCQIQLPAAKPGSGERRVLLS